MRYAVGMQILRAFIQANRNKIILTVIRKFVDQLYAIPEHQQSRSRLCGTETMHISILTHLAAQYRRNR